MGYLEFTEGVGFLAAAERQYRWTDLSDVGWHLGSAAPILRAVITELRERIARVLALCVFVVTFGRVQVNPSGKSTASDPGRADALVAAKHEP